MIDRYMGSQVFPVVTIARVSQHPKSQDTLHTGSDPAQNRTERSDLLQRSSAVVITTKIWGHNPSNLKSNCMLKLGTKNTRFMC